MSDDKKSRLTVEVPVEKLQEWREGLGRYWFSSYEGDEYNNDEVIQCCDEIDALLKEVK